MKNFLKILLGVMLAITAAVLGYALFMAGTQSTEEAVNAAVELNLYWAYVLCAVVAFSTLFSAVYGMLKSSGGLLKTLLSAGLVIAVCVVSYVIASGHTVEIVNIENGGFFDAGDTIITETSVLIAYVAMAGAFVAAIASEVMGAFK